MRRLVVMLVLLHLVVGLAIAQEPRIMGRGSVFYQQFSTLDCNDWVLYLTTAQAGVICWDTDDQLGYVWDGTEWDLLIGGGGDPGGAEPQFQYHGPSNQLLGSEKFIFDSVTGWPRATEGYIAGNNVDEDLTVFMVDTLTDDRELTYNNTYDILILDGPLEVQDVIRTRWIEARTFDSVQQAHTTRIFPSTGSSTQDTGQITFPNTPNYGVISWVDYELGGADDGLYLKLTGNDPGEPVILEGEGAPFNIQTWTTEELRLRTNRQTRLSFGGSGGATLTTDLSILGGDLYSNDTVQFQVYSDCEVLGSDAVGFLECKASVGPTEIDLTADYPWTGRHSWGLSAVDAASQLTIAPQLLDRVGVIVRRGINEPLDPATLNPEFWFDAADTTNTGDGTDVTAWTDKSGNGYDVTVGTIKPTYVASDPSMNNKPSVQMTGDDDVDLGQAFTIGAAQNYTFFVVVNQNTAVDPTIELFGDLSCAPATKQSWQFEMFAASSTARFRYCNQVNSQFTALSGGVSVAIFEGVRLDSIPDFEVHQAFRNGTKYTGNPTFAGTGEVDTLFRAVDGIATPAGVRFAEVIYFGYSLTGSQREGVRNWLAQKYNITVASQDTSTPDIQQWTNQTGDTVWAGINFTGEIYDPDLVSCSLVTDSGGAFECGAIPPSISGGDGEVLLSDGAGGIKSDADFTYNTTTDTLDITNLTVDDITLAGAGEGGIVHISSGSLAASTNAILKPTESGLGNEWAEISTPRDDGFVIKGGGGGFRVSQGQAYVYDGLGGDCSSNNIPCIPIIHRENREALMPNVGQLGSAGGGLVRDLTDTECWPVDGSNFVGPFEMFSNSIGNCSVTTATTCEDEYDCPDGTCDGDSAPCDNDLDCVGHGGFELCENAETCVNREDFVWICLNADDGVDYFRIWIRGGSAP